MFASRKIRRGGTQILDFTVEGESTVSTASTTHTHTSVGIGTADSDRIVIVAIGAGLAITGPLLSNVTIGGVTATRVQSGDTVALAYARVTSGTTANIVLTSSAGSFSSSEVKAYRLIKSDISPIDSGTVSGTAPQSISNIECDPGGVVLVASGVSLPVIITIKTVNAWNGSDSITTDYTPNPKLTASHVLIREKSTIRDVTVSQTASDTVYGAVASW